MLAMLLPCAQAQTVYSGAVEDYLLPVEEFSREREHAPEFVMIHFTSAIVEHRDDPFSMGHIRQIFVDYDISVHYIIDRDGAVRCYIPEDRVARHAGKGEFANGPKYTNRMNQYASLKLLVSDLCSRYGIPMDRDHVIGHQDYSPAKNDPGELFDRSRLLGE